jgi:hypothetical protein
MPPLDLEPHRAAAVDPNEIRAGEREEDAALPVLVVPPVGRGRAWLMRRWAIQLGESVPAWLRPVGRGRALINRDPMTEFLFNHFRLRFMSDMPIRPPAGLGHGAPRRG